MSVKDQVLSLLQCKEWVSCAEMELLFPPGTEGHLSWSQRLRSLREDGLTIEKRLKAGSKHTWEYHLVKPQPQYQIQNGQLSFV